MDIVKYDKTTEIVLGFIRGTESREIGSRVHIPEGLAAAKYIAAVKEIRNATTKFGDKFAVDFQSYMSLCRESHIVPPDYAQNPAFFFERNNRLIMSAQALIRYSYRFDDGRVTIEIFKRIAGLDDRVINLMNAATEPIRGNVLFHLESIGPIEHSESYQPSEL